MRPVSAAQHRICCYGEDEGSDLAPHSSSRLRWMVPHHARMRRLVVLVAVAALLAGECESGAFFCFLLPAAAEFCECRSAPWTEAPRDSTSQFSLLTLKYFSFQCRESRPSGWKRRTERRCGMSSSCTTFFFLLLFFESLKLSVHNLKTRREARILMGRTHFYHSPPCRRRLW